MRIKLKNLSKCLKPVFPKLKDLRRLEAFPPIYLLIVEEYPLFQEKLFKCLVFTEDIEEGTLSGNTPFLILEKEKIILVGLPLWIYCLEAFLLNYSTRIGKVSSENIEEFIQYAKKTPIPGTPQGKYIKNIAKALASINTFSLFEFLENLENEEVELCK